VLRVSRFEDNMCVDDGIGENHRCLEQRSACRTLEYPTDSDPIPSQVFRHLALDFPLITELFVMVTTPIFVVEFTSLRVYVRSNRFITTTRNWFVTKLGGLRWEAWDNRMRH
jgi:hypothetical protein